MEQPIEELVLKPRFWKLIGIRLLGAGGTALGIWLICTGDWIGWFVTAMFALISFTASIQFIPGSTYVRIHSEGFEVCFLFRPRHVLWKDVTRFGVANHNSSRMVVYDFVPEYHGLVLTRAWCRRMFGWDATLPDSFGMSCEDLADLMNHCKQTLSRDECRLPFREQTLPGVLP